jgi:HNH endonuclease
MINPISNQLDHYTSYYFDENGNFILNMKGIRESSNPNEIFKYTKKDIKEYYSVNRDNFRLEIIEESRTKRYFVINETENLLFIPITNQEKNVVTYTCSELDNYKILKQHSFCRNIIKNKIYIQRTSDKKLMHQIVFGQKAPKGKVIDHINSNGLDNRKVNIRIVDYSENSYNQKPNINNSSGGLIGVSWNKAKNKWRSRINVQGKEVHLGLFDDEVEAAKIRDIYTLTHGLKARLNQIDGKNILSKEEIDDVLKNPEKYIKTEKKRELPRYIKKTKIGYRFIREFTEYFDTEEKGDIVLEQFKVNFPEIKALKNARIKFNENKKNWELKIRFDKSYKELNSAIKDLDILKKFIFNLDEKEKEELENNIEEHRNEQGIAILKTYNGKTKTYVDIKVDDDDWKEFIHYKWYIDGDGYPASGKLNDCLHRIIFKKHFSDLYNNRDNQTIDHIDQEKIDARKLKLKLATPSQQALNKTLTRKSQISYPGVYLYEYGKYYAKCQNVESKKFEYIEDAVRAHNAMMEDIDPNYKKQEVPDTKTTAKDIYGNPDQELINSIKTILEMKVVFRINFLETYNYIKEMRARDLEKYKEHARRLCNKVLQN